jgi:hypothetical protein
MGLHKLDVSLARDLWLRRLVLGLYDLIDRVDLGIVTKSQEGRGAQRLNRG